MTKPDYELLDAEQIFTQVLSEMMVEEGFTYDRYSPSELHGVMAECCAQYQKIYELYLLDVLYGNDKKARTRVLIKAFGNKNNRIFRR